jgi:hypothetical protein
MFERIASATRARLLALGSGILLSCIAAGPVLAAPSVIATFPSDGSANVALPTNVSVTFSQTLDPMALTWQTTAGACSGTMQVSTFQANFTSCIGLQPVNLDGPTYTFAPTPGLPNGSGFRIRVKGSVTAGGMPMGADYTHLMGFFTHADATCATGVTISQVYANGGGMGSSYAQDFVELHNPGNRPAALDGYSLQVSQDGMIWTKAIDFPGMTTIPAGGYVLVGLGMPGGNGAALPTPDFNVGAQLSPTSGLVVLTPNAMTYSCGAGPANRVDLVGYGSVGCGEGAPTPQLSATTAALRGNDGCLDSNSNAADFTAATPAPRNFNSMTTHVCSCVANETDLPGELDYCNLQSPPTMSVDAGAMTPSVYAQVFDAGLTEPMGSNSAIAVQIGYGPPGANPQNQPGWTWFPTVFNQQVSNNDEYTVSFGAPAVAGSYRYGARATKDGINWTYCDLNSAGVGGMLSFEPWLLGAMNANAVPVAPHITSANNTTFVVDVANSFTPATTGYPPPSFTLNGALPPEVFFNGMTGEISGTPGPGSVGGWPIVLTATNGVMPDATQIFALVVARPQCTLDVDGDGSVNVLTDGLLLLRAMLGLTGTAVTDHALGEMASRNSWTAIRQYLNGACGATFAQ